MIYIKNFKNYEEFKQIFGMSENGTRKNKILLGCLKDREWIRFVRSFDGKKSSYADFMSEFDNVKTSIGVKFFFKRYIERSGSIKSLELDIHSISLNGWRFHSQVYKLDENNGIPVDDDVNFIRYILAETNRVYKMRAGKFISKLFSELSHFPEQAKIFLQEEFCSEWVTYVSNKKGKNLHLVVDDDFEAIYDKNNYDGYNFHSCMSSGDYGYDHHLFYENAVEAKAASLRNEDGVIFARCIIFTQVYDENGDMYRLAERQYSRDCDDVLKRQLIDALIKEGHIDGYKIVGVDCGCSRSFVSIKDEDWSGKDFSIKCYLECGDNLSYQDTFKWYSKSERLAWNNCSHSYDSDLASTEEIFENDDVYSDHYNCYIREDDACYVERYSDYYYSSDVVWTVGCYELEEDCMRCDGCNEWVYSDDAYYSELTDEYYCSISCMEEAEDEYKERNWHYSELTDEYYEDESELEDAEQDYKESHWNYSELTEEYYETLRELEYAETEYKKEFWFYSEYDDVYVENADCIEFMFSWNRKKHCYEETTILRESLIRDLSYGDIKFYMGKYYSDFDEDGVPYGFNRKNELEIPNVA